MNDTAVDTLTPRYNPDHMAGLRRFSISITVVTIVGHLFLGFEQSFAQPFVAMFAAYATQLFLETVEAKCQGRRTRFSYGLQSFLDFMASAHITAMSVSMLLYANDRLWVMAFASVIGIASKYVFRAPIGGGKTRHFFNPSNLALSVTLVMFPWVGLGIPWGFTANTTGIMDFVIVLCFWILGIFLNWRCTHRLPLCISLLVGIVAQAIIRHLVFGQHLLPALGPATGVAAVVYVWLMVPDPATTPSKTSSQIIFGLSIAALYLVFMRLHIVYGLFFALTLVCAGRGIGLYILAMREEAEPEAEAAPAT